MFIALLEIENKPAMRELNEKIKEINSIIQAMGPNDPKLGECFLILTSLSNQRRELRKELYKEYELQWSKK